MQQDRNDDEANELYTDIPVHDSVYTDCNDTKSNEKDIFYYSSVHYGRNESTVDEVYALIPDVDEVYARIPDIVNRDSNEGEDMYSGVHLQYVA